VSKAEPISDPTPPSEVRDRARIIHAHQAWVWRYFRFLGCDAASADDLTQDTFVAVLRGASAIAPEAMRSYLRRTAVSVWIKSNRRRSCGVSLEGTQLADESYALFCARDDGDTYLEALRQCVEELSERRRQLLVLRYEQGLSRRDVGGRMGLTEDGVKSLVKRSFARLRVCIEHRREGDA
jgi:RNA polymerase sigma-70 factor (ECF subfamily)